MAFDLLSSRFGEVIVSTAATVKLLIHRVLTRFFKAFKKNEKRKKQPFIIANQNAITFFLVVLLILSAYLISKDVIHSINQGELPLSSRS